jgi:amino acid transporter
MDEPGGEPLVRAIGFRGLTLSTLNLIVGASIFVLPAVVALDLGRATVAKPIVLVIVAGAFLVNPANLRWEAWPSLSAMAKSSLFLLFAYSGFESVFTGGGEIRDPSRTIPRALPTARASCPRRGRLIAAWPDRRSVRALPPPPATV